MRSSVSMEANISKQSPRRIDCSQRTFGLVRMAVLLVGSVVTRRTPLAAAELLESIPAGARLGRCCTGSVVCVERSKLERAFVIKQNQSKLTGSVGSSRGDIMLIAFTAALA
jgi:hypothetical protein